MTFTINSRKHGPVTFSRPGLDYVYVDLNGKPGTLGLQICEGGNMSGHTITASRATPAQFEKICRRWWAGKLRQNRQWGA